MYNFTDNEDGVRDRSYLDKFIVDSCWGVASNKDWGDDAEHNKEYTSVDVMPIPTEEDEEDGFNTAEKVLLQNLLEEVESACNAVSDDSSRRSFYATETCKLLVTCRGELINSLDNSSTTTELDEYDTCGGLTAEELEEELTECEENGSRRRFRERRKLAVSADLCPAYLQGYFKSFPPDYPNNENDDPTYNRDIVDLSAPASAKDDTRTSADYVSYLLIVRAALKVADILTEAFGEALPDDSIYVFWKWVPYGITHYPLYIMEQAISLYDFHDGNIDGAEIEAYYENSRQLLDGSAALFDAVRCRKSLDGDHLEVKWGQGCDSVDNDCDYVVDECDEDRIDPEIDATITYAVCGEKWFGSVTEAKECIEKTITAVDDCDPSLTVTVLEGVPDECGITDFTVSAETSRCEQITTTTVTLQVADPAASPNTLTCSLGGQQDIILEATGNSQLENIDLSYQIGDESLDCDTGDIQVSVQVLSNEIEDLHNQAMAAIFLYGDPDGKPSAYIAKGLCETASNGQCIRDPAFPDTKLRLYTFRITVVDDTGNPNSCEARALVLPTDLNSTIGFDDVVDSTQQFLLTEYKHTIKQPV